MWKRIYQYFDKLEDRVRIRLSHHPIMYAFVGAVGIVLVWKGVWETAELFQWLNGPMSFIVGAGILLVTGLLVSFFIGEDILISGFRQEKKLVEKSEHDIIKAGEEQAGKILEKLDHLESDIHDLKGHEKVIT